MVSVAVTGVGAIAAVGPTATDIWSAAMLGQTGIAPLRRPSTVVDGRWMAGQVPDAWLEGATATTRTARMAELSVREALCSAGWNTAPPVAKRIAVVVGTCLGALLGPEPFHPDIAASLHEIDALADHVAGMIGAAGPRITITTACSSATNALGAARLLLRDGEADAAVVCGADELCLPSFASFGSVGALSSSACAPYSRSDGMNPGEGAGALVLERGDDATRRGAPVRAYLSGYGSSADAYHPSAPDPTGNGAALAVERALCDAGLRAVDVAYINGHGTGTGPNDSMERALFRRLFPNVPVSSTKSLTGHAFGGSSAIEAVMSVLAVERDEIPATANFVASSGVDDSDDFVANSGRAHNTDVALTTSYAFGGNNAAAILTKHPTSAPTDVRHDVVVAGLGVVGTKGVGRERWWELLDNETDVTDDHLIAEPALDPLRYADKKNWKRMSRLARSAVAAVRLALEDANAWPVVGGDDVAVVVTMTDGPTDLASELGKILHSGPATVSPFLSSNIASSSTGGHVAAAFALRGPAVTLMGAAAGIAGWDFAQRLVARGAARAAVVVGADIVCDDTARMYPSHPVPVVEAAVAAVFQRRTDRHGDARQSLLVSTKVGSTCRSGDLHRALSDAMAEVVPADGPLPEMHFTGPLSGAVVGVTTPVVPWKVAERVLGDSRGGGGTLALLAAAHAVDRGCPAAVASASSQSGHIAAAYLRRDPR